MSDILQQLERRIERVVRGGKVKRKLKCKPGYKAQGGKCVRMSPQEQRKRKRSSKVGARKRKATKSQSTRKRALSMRKRKGSGLK